MSNPLRSDQSLLTSIRDGSPKERNAAMKYIYNHPDWKEPPLHYVRQNGGANIDLEDLWHEALITFQTNLRGNKFREGAALKTYLYSIVKNKWLNLSRKMKRRSKLQRPLSAAEQITVADELAENEKKEFLLEAIAQLGERCRKVLFYYMHNYSMQEIARLVPLSSAQYAKNEASRFRKILSNYLTRHSGWQA